MCNLREGIERALCGRSYGLCGIRAVGRIDTIGAIKLGSQSGIRPASKAR